MYLPDGVYSAVIQAVDEVDNGKGSMVVWTLTVPMDGVLMTVQSTNYIPKGIGFLKQALEVIFDDKPERARDIPRWLESAVGATVEIEAKTTKSESNGREYHNIYFRKLVSGSGKPHPRELPPLNDPADGFKQADDGELPF